MESLINGRGEDKNTLQLGPLQVGLKIKAAHIGILNAAFTKLISRSNLGCIHIIFLFSVLHTVIQVDCSW